MAVALNVLMQRQRKKLVEAFARNGLGACIQNIYFQLVAH